MKYIYKWVKYEFVKLDGIGAFEKLSYIFNKKQINAYL